VTPTSDIVAGDGVSEVDPGIGILAGTTRSFVLGPFDTLNLETTLTNYTQDPWGDLTGTVVTADQPVAVFTGVDLTMVVESPDPFDDDCCADHIEQQVPAEGAMGLDFAVPHSAQRGATVIEADLYRIIAAYDGTAVTTSLPAPNDSFTLDRGEVRDFFATTGFTVEASGPVHVAQLLVVKTQTDPPAGDTSMVYIPPLDRLRAGYVVTTGTGYDSHHAVVVTPAGAPVKVDGAMATSVCDGPTAIGDIGGQPYETWDCPLSEGDHTIHTGASLAQPGPCIGVIVYGYAAGGSYAYSAG